MVYDPYSFYTLTFTPPGLVPEFQKGGVGQKLADLKTDCTHQPSIFLKEKKKKKDLLERILRHFLTSN